MISIEKRERIDETNTRKSFNENFYTGNSEPNRTKTYKVETIRKKINNIQKSAHDIINGIDSIFWIPRNI